MRTPCKCYRSYRLTMHRIQPNNRHGPQEPHVNVIIHICWAIHRNQPKKSHGQSEHHVNVTVHIDWAMQRNQPKENHGK